jgi:hypothetical protein
MGRQTAQDDVVLEAKLQDLQRLVCPEAVTDQYSWLTISSGSSFDIKNTL